MKHKQPIESAFRILCNMLGRDDLTLDYYAIGGGYRIMTTSGECPFGNRRYMPAQFLLVLNFAIDTVRTVKEGNHADH